jgi:hypothetical protein
MDHMAIYLETGFEAPIDVLHANLKLYLYYRTKVLLDVDEDIPDRINSAVDFLLRHQGSSRQKDREHYLRQLCKLTVEYQGLDFIPRLRLGLGDDYSSQVPNSEVEDVLTAVSALGSTECLRAVLEQDLRDVSKPSLCFGNPLHYALQQGNLLHMKLILDHLRNAPKEALLLDTQRGQTMAENLLSNPINQAIRTAKSDMAQLLLEFHQQLVTKADAKQWSGWLGDAVKSDEVKIVESVLQKKTHCKNRVPLKIFANACEMGNAKIVRALLGRGRMPPNKLFTHDCPLTLAMNHHGKELVKAVLEGGAHPDGPDTKRKSRDWKWLTPMFRAIGQGSEEIVGLLLDYGADIDKRSANHVCIGKMSPLEYAVRKEQKDIYARLRQAKMRKDGGYVDTFEQAKPKLKPADYGVSLYRGDV